MRNELPLQGKGIGPTGTANFSFEGRWGTNQPAPGTARFALLEVSDRIFPPMTIGIQFGVPGFPSAHKGGPAKTYPETMGAQAGPSVSNPTRPAFNTTN